MNLTKILTAIASLMFFMIGFDKFLKYLEPPCSLEETIGPTIWSIFGVIQIATGILIWLPKFKKPLAIFFTFFMLAFTITHIVNGQSDIGGSAFMTVLLGVLAWNPNILQGNKS